MDTDGGGWTVFQRRQDGSENFNQRLDTYINGFGNPIGEFWLGLEAIHRLTPNRSITTLRVDLRDLQGNPGNASYDTFGVLGSSRDYELIVARYIGGNAGDSLSVHTGVTFVTDENDIGGNCARFYFCGWSFQPGLYNGKCFAANLNGLFTPRPDRYDHPAIYWLSFSESPLTFSEMKFRRRA